MDSRTEPVKPECDARLSVALPAADHQALVAMAGRRRCSAAWLARVAIAYLLAHSAEVMAYEAE